jgi:hypothetical protein
LEIKTPPRLFLLSGLLLLRGFKANRTAAAHPTPPRSLGLSGRLVGLGLSGRLVGLGYRRSPAVVADLRKGLGVVASGTRLMHDNLTLPRQREVLSHVVSGVDRVRHRFGCWRVARDSRPLFKYQRTLKSMQRLDKMRRV